jgi:DnaB-like helicase N terminal domain
MVLEAALLRDFAADLALRAGPGSDAALSETMTSYTRNINAARAAAADDAREPGPPPADPRAAREERFLSALMRQPGLADWISVDPEVFTSPGRRDIYQAITALTRHGEPVDEITLAWALARATAPTPRTPPASRTSSPATCPPAKPASLADQEPPAAAARPGAPVQARRGPRPTLARDRAAARARRAHHRGPRPPPVNACRVRARRVDRAPRGRGAGAGRRLRAHRPAACHRERDHPPDERPPEQQVDHGHRALVQRAPLAGDDPRQEVQPPGDGGDDGELDDGPGCIHSRDGNRPERRGPGEGTLDTAMCPAAPVDKGPGLASWLAVILAMITAMPCHARSVRVRRQGLEPRTRRLRVCCSAN